jgi:hypothetical protein
VKVDSRCEVRGVDGECSVVRHSAMPSTTPMDGESHDATCALVHHDRDTAHDVLVDDYAEGQGDLLSNPATTQDGFRCFMTSTDSATTDRAPPGPASRAIVDSR